MKSPIALPLAAPACPAERRGACAPDQRTPDTGSLLAAMHGLARQLADGRHPLRGRNLLLLDDAHGAEAGSRLERAATALGAGVARPAPGGLGPGTARLLSRLYDAVVCEGGDAGLAARLGEEAGVPVWCGLARALPPAAVLAALEALRGAPLAGLGWHSGPAGHVAGLGLADAAQDAGIPLACDGAADTWVAIDGADPAGWQVEIGGSPVEPARWRAELARQHQHALQALLLHHLLG